MRLELSPKTLRDLEEIGDYIANDNPLRALSFIEEIEHKCKKIAENPKIGVLRPEFAENLRLHPHGKYLIFYSVKPDLVRIERVLHGNRNLIDSDLFS